MSNARPGWTPERRKRFMATLAEKRRASESADLPANDRAREATRRHARISSDVSQRLSTLPTMNGAHQRDRVLTMMHIIDQHRAHWPAVLTIEEVLALAWDLAAVESPPPDAAP